MSSPATIADRNRSNCSWASAVGSDVLSDFFQERLYVTATGAERLTYLSAKSLLILCPKDPTYLRRFYPWAGQRLADAVVSQQDQAYILTLDHWVHRCVTPGPGGISDWPDASLNLQDYMLANFTHLEVNEAFGGVRMIACWGPDGVLLLQVDEETFRVQSALRIDEDSGMLAGSDTITFLRMSNVVSTTSGRILLGTKLSDGTTTELMIDVASRTPASVWTPDVKLSPTVTTGEILSTTQGLSSRPNAPKWLGPEVDSPTTMTLRWSQDRPDRVAGYEVWCGKDAAAPTLYATTSSGSIRHVSLRVERGHFYRLTVRALGVSAMSAFSDELVVGDAPMALAPWTFSMHRDHMPAWNDNGVDPLAPDSEYDTFDRNPYTWTVQWPVENLPNVSTLAFTQDDPPGPYTETWTNGFRVACKGVSGGALTLAITILYKFAGGYSNTYTFHAVINGITLSAEATIEWICDGS